MIRGEIEASDGDADTRPRERPGEMEGAPLHVHLEESEASSPAETCPAPPLQPLNHHQTYPNKLFGSLERILRLERHSPAVEPAHGKSCVLSGGPR